MIPVLMPIADGQFIPGHVLLGLLRQDIELLLTPVSSPPQASRRSGEATSRNILIQSLADIPCEVAFMIDRDVVLDTKTIARCAVELLLSTPSCGAVHVPHKPNGDRGHWDIGCVVFRKKIAENLVFPTMETERCFCAHFQGVVSGAGYCQRWIDGPCLEAYEITIRGRAG